MCCFPMKYISIILELHLLFKNDPPPKKTYLALNCLETSCCSKRVLPFHFNYPLESCNSANYCSCNEAAVGLVVIVSKIIQHCCKVSSNPACSIWNTHFLNKLPFLVVVQGSQPFRENRIRDFFEFTLSPYLKFRNATSKLMLSHPVQV